MQKQPFAQPPFASLVEDHKKVKGIIEQLLATSATAKKTRQDLLGSLKKELESHEALEEKLLYPALKQQKPTHDMALEAYQEHHVVDVLLDELESLDFQDEAWKAKLRVLQENLLHHIREEEEQLFPKAAKTLDEGQLNHIEQGIEQARR